MKRLGNRASALLMAALLLLGCLPSSALAADSDGQGKTATILFTHDMHSHLLPAKKEGGGEYGGFARLASVLKAERAASAALGIPTITVDGGDFSMGSLFQTIYTKEATELRSLGLMGYDAVTLGNHEFEYRAQGLGEMLRAALAGGDALPAIVQANYTTPADPQADKAAAQAMKDYGVTDYTMVEKDGVRFAVFGVLGKDADDCAPMSGMEFTPIAEAAQRVVNEIKEKEQYDFIICLSHSGTSENTKKSEDEQLARSVDGIDFIVSGHTHRTLTAPIIINNTIIGSTGEYCTNLGKITIQKGADGKNTVAGYNLISIDESVPEDEGIAAEVGRFKSLVETEYLSRFHLAYDQVLAYSPFDFTPISSFAREEEEDSLGNLITDAYLYAVRRVEEGTGAAPIAAAFVNSGVIRASFAKGNITVSDVFDVSSIGSGADGTAGYPLIDVWLTGEEIKNVMEVDPSVGPIFSGAQLYASGVSYRFNMRRMIFNRMTDPALLSSDGGKSPLEDNKLYRVVTNLYSSQMLGLVTEKSFGILKITPKDAKGEPILDYENHIIHLSDGSELKEWYAVATYLASFTPENGVPQVPRRYAGPEGRKVRVDSISPIAMLKEPNWVTLLTAAVVVLVLAGAVLLIYRVATRKRRRTRGRSCRAKGYENYRG